MARIRLSLPGQFSFTTTIAVRITDINYGGHLGNDAVLSLMHEARMQFLSHHGYAELSIEGAGMIMSDVAIEFRNEAFYGEVLTASVAAGEFSRVGFELYYRFTKLVNDKEVLVAIAKTGMVCYDYANKKIAQLPDRAKEKLSS